MGVNKRTEKRREYEREYMRRRRRQQGGMTDSDLVNDRARNKLLKMARAGEFGDVWERLLQEARRELIADGTIEAR